MVRWKDHVFVRLLKADSTPFLLVEDDNVQYAVALPGEAFTMEVFCRPPRTKLPIAIRAEPLIDGRYLGYSGILRERRLSYQFEGWLEPTAKLGSRITAFAFAKPQVDEAASASVPRPAESLAGSIKVAFNIVEKVHCAVKPGQLKFPSGTSKGTAPAPKVAKLPEGKKFFSVPSLVSGKGAPVKLDKDWTKAPAKAYKHISVKHITVVELRYELPSTLLARGLLDVDNPAHKAALDAETGVPPRASRVKRRRADDRGAGVRVKRERGSNAGGGPVVDLTHVPVDPLLEVCCDLTEDDVAAPKWTVRRKQPEVLG